MKIVRPKLVRLKIGFSWDSNDIERLDAYVEENYQLGVKSRGDLVEAALKTIINSDKTFNKKFLSGHYSKTPLKDISNKEE